MTATLSCINGLLDQALDPRDRAIHYGDGVFRTLQTRQGTLVHWPDHYDKLNLDAARLQLRCPSAECWESDIAQLQPDTHVIKLILTRGSGKRGYTPPEGALPTRIVQRSALSLLPPQAYAEGVVLKVCQLRLSLQPLLAGIKHLNRLEQVLAGTELAGTCYFDGLLLDAEGYVIQAIRHNVFYKRGDDTQWFTPRLERCGVAGVTRARWMRELQSALAPVCEADVTTEQLADAQQLWICNSLSGRLPVRQIDWPDGSASRYWVSNGCAAESAPHQKRAFRSI